MIILLKVFGWVYWTPDGWAFVRKGFKASKA